MVLSKDKRTVARESPLLANNYFCPVHRGKRVIPEVTPRLETNALRAGSDLTGAFIQGDDALGFLLSLKVMIQAFDQSGIADGELWCALNELRYLANIFEQVFEKEVVES